MKERPILFSSPMVRAILDGRKTQTRRIVKPQPEQHAPCDDRDDGWRWPSTKCRSMLDLHEMPSLCPHGVRGERLWVRETHVLLKGPRRDEPGVITKGGGTVAYRASVCDGFEEAVWPVWRPSIFMPRWASRITLEIVEVRVQRLQEISEDDARAEGVEPYTPPHGCISPDQRVPGPGFDRCRLGDQPHRLPFADLWDRINGKRASWASNPWVWALTFRRLP